MTLLAAVWDLGGRSSLPDCQSILRAQGADVGRLAAHVDGGVSLAKTLKAALPEDRFDMGPALSRDGALACVADVRLDNRDDLRRGLGCSEADAAELSDTMLMMRCFERRGEAAFEDFVGDFAVALWDGRSERLLLARDFAAQRPLFFAHDRRRIVVASMATGLQAVEALPGRVDEQRIVQSLLGLPECGSRSFFEGIERVEPGQIMSFSRDQRRSRIFWSPRAQEIRYRSPGDYADALNEKLDIAVRSRLRGAGPRVAAHLSAGLDSSAVTAAVALASTLPILAMTSVPSGDLPRLPEGRHGDEGGLASETAARYRNIEHRLIPIGGSLGLAGLEGQLRRFERPDLNLPNLVWFNSINSHARSEGIGVILTGAMGNATISYGGEELFGELLVAGRWGQFLREFSAASGNDISLRALLGWSTAPIRRRAPFKDWRAGCRTAQALRDSMLHRDALKAAYSLYRDADHLDRDLKDSVSRRIHVIRRIDPGSYNKGVLLGWDVDLRDPTADRRLVEFCLSVPLDQWFRDGVPRALARASLEGRVPEPVRRLGRRGLQSPNWFAQLSADRSECRRILERVGGCEQAAAILDIAKMKRMLDAWPAVAGGFGPIHYRTGLLRGLAMGEFIRIFTGSR